MAYRISWTPYPNRCPWVLRCLATGAAYPNGATPRGHMIGQQPKRFPDAQAAHDYAIRHSIPLETERSAPERQEPRDFYLVRSDGVTEGSVLETIDGTYVIAVNGIQWGSKGAPRDRSGCADTEFQSPEEALGAFAQAYGLDEEELTLEER